VALVYLVPAEEVPTNPEDPECESKVWVPTYDPKGTEMHDHDRIWYAETTPPKLIRVIRGTPPPPSWARAADVTFLGQFPDDPARIRRWAAAYFRGDKEARAKLEAELHPTFPVGPTGSKIAEALSQP
jgi:hypothetical protein